MSRSRHTCLREVKLFPHLKETAAHPVPTFDGGPQGPHCSAVYLTDNIRVIFARVVFHNLPNEPVGTCLSEEYWFNESGPDAGCAAKPWSLHRLNPATDKHVVDVVTFNRTTGELDTRHLAKSLQWLAGGTQMYAGIQNLSTVAFACARAYVPTHLKDMLQRRAFNTCAHVRAHATNVFTLTSLVSVFI